MAAPSALPRVLIVDDEPQVLRALSRTLRGRFEVATAPDAAAGLAALRAFRPHVVVSDFRMPGDDGLAFLDRVAAERPGAARVLLSGYSLPTGTGRRPVDLVVLPKPWQVDALVETLEALAERASLTLDPR